MADTRIVVTANAATQLSTKTWPELIKWLRLAINRHWFRATATSLYSADETHERLWRADAIRGARRIPKPSPGSTTPASAWS
jgi:hypothetical protein